MEFVAIVAFARKQRFGVGVGDSVEDYILEQTLAAMDVVAQSAMAKAA